MRKICLCQCLLSKNIWKPPPFSISALRQLYTGRISSDSPRLEKVASDDCNENEIPEVLKIMRDNRIVFSTYIHKKGMKLDPKSRLFYEKRYKKQMIEQHKKQAIPLFLENMLKTVAIHDVETETDDISESRGTLPFAQVENIDINETSTNSVVVNDLEYDWHSSKSSVKEDVAERLEAYEENKSFLKNVGDDISSSSLSYEETFPFDDKQAIKELVESYEENSMEFGTCNPDVAVSNVPCGGCGAFLHCQDYGLPGFLPKEVFEGLDRGQLRGEICQRCYFLKHHNVALNVRVSPDVYQKILEPIKDKKALVIVVVDLLDVPCSLWPNLLDIVGTRRPVVIVGNKVDLLPADGRNHLQKIKDCLRDAIDSTPLGRANIRHVSLISAFTGFGIENLITKIQKSWGVQGDIYIVGCTNSGKSTLFNAMLGSDMCKVDASDLIKRATTSPWPGTTLNMLKFPVLRPSGYRIYLRTLRMKEQRRKVSLDKSDEYTYNRKSATLSGILGRTFVKEEVNEKRDPFATKTQKMPSSAQPISGINENDLKYVEGKWCYDTPGTVQPDQLTNLLTHEELMMVLPKELIVPRTYSVRSGESIFLGGLARLDVLYCTARVRLTVFASDSVPINIVKAVDASSFYRHYLGSDLLAVPRGDKERMKHWPTLSPCDFKMIACASEEACGDVVLSSAGWITVTTKENAIVEVRGWTPGGRGIYLRNPSILPRIASLSGARISKSPAHKRHKLLIPRVGSGD